MKAFLRGSSRQKAKEKLADTAGTSSAGATTSSSRSSNRDFEVFLNFRGSDTRFTVVNVLYDALDRAGIQVFYDDDSIRQGEIIEGELKQAIVNSKIYILIFSKDYASSKWCLRELELILECWKASRMQGEKKTILPIFCGVHVSTDLKLRSDSYATALKGHKKKLGEDVVKPWENALRMVATIKGWNIRDHGLTKLTKRIVEEVCQISWRRSDPEKISKDYVGIDRSIKHIMFLLDLDVHDDVRFVTIYGMGGVGKTTLARLVFNKISSSFNRRVAFLSNIREKSYRDGGILDLQKDLISQLLQVNSSLFLRDVDDGVEMIKDRLKDKKVLIVLDDIDNTDQLAKLARETSWFGAGSRIIVTTRNIGIMPTNGYFYEYKMRQMRHCDALKLFSRQVFNSDSPPKEYTEFSNLAVETTGGLPLAIGVIASLFRNNSKDTWKGTLEKLRNVVHKDVRKKLMISYEQLDYYEKDIFLDVACLFINKDVEDAAYYWEARRLYPKSCIMVLKNMSLIEIVDGNKLWMHDILRDLGRNLVDEETNIHGRPSRLWSQEAVQCVLRRRKVIEKVVALKHGSLDANHTLTLDLLKKLRNLKFLELNGEYFINEDSKVDFSGLIWLSWDNCSFGQQQPRIPGFFLLFHVVILILSENFLTDDWNGWHAIREAPNLKVLKCTYCRYMLKSPEFHKIKLERLVFKNCASLREIDPSICNLEYLTYLEITNPLIYRERLHDEYLPYQLEEVVPQILPITIGSLKSLLELKLKFVNLSELPDSIGELVNLKYLCLWCPKLIKLPESVGLLKSLVELDISFTTFTCLPKTVVDLESLRVLKCENCRLQVIPDEIKNLVTPSRSERIESLKNK